MGAIKLPVTAIKWGLYVGNDMDDEEAWIGDFVDEDMASEAATALNERPALIAERDGLRAALEIARQQLVVLGGDPSGDAFGDGIQAGVLAVIDAALSKSGV